MISHTRPQRELIVFTKEPVAGQVKTRLMATIGAERAAGVYTILIRAVLTQCIHPEQLWRIVAVLTPDSALPRARTFIPDRIDLRPQGEGDLGDRLRNAVRVSWEQGTHQTVLIGTDCPELTVQDIEQAFDALGKNDAVIGPAIDGGYYLIGINRKVGDRVARLFGDIEWSTAKVFHQTMDRIKREGLRCVVLPERRDIDRYEDLTALLRTCSPELKSSIEAQLAS